MTYLRSQEQTAGAWGSIRARGIPEHHRSWSPGYTEGRPHLLLSTGAVQGPTGKGANPLSLELRGSFLSCEKQAGPNRAQI